MNYTALIKDSYRIAWNSRYLWLFGFFAGGGGGGSLPNSGSQDGDKAVSALRSFADGVMSNPALLIGLALAAVVLLLIFLVLHFLSYGGLVKTVAEIEEGKRPDFDDALNHGYRYFWKMVGMQLLFFLVIVVFIFLWVVLMILILGASGAMKAVGIILLIALILPALASLLLLLIVMTLATRIAIIDDAAVGESVSRAIGLIRTHFSDCVSLFVISLGVAIAFFVVFFAAVVMLAIPFVIAGIFNLWLGLVPGLLIGLPLLVLVQCVYGVYTSAYWTLGYMRLFQKQAEPVAPTAGPDSLVESLPAAGIA